MAFGRDIRVDELRSLGFASIGPTFTQISTRLDQPTRIVIIQNDTDASLIFSFTGDTDHIFLPPSTQVVLDGTANKVTESGYFFSVGTRFSIRHDGVAPTSGSVYVTAMHGRGD